MNEYIENNSIKCITSMHRNNTLNFSVYFGIRGVRRRKTKDVGGLNYICIFCP